MTAPWFVGGGAEHSPETARAVAFAATGGQQGIVTPEAYRVVPLAVPGGAVRVLAGAAVIRNRYTGGALQSYMTRRGTETQLPITATGSGGGRTDLVIQRIDDPQYGGTLDPTSPTAVFDPFVVIPGVAAGATVESLNLPYPAIALARITLPASTATVQASHITDLRKVAQPRRERRMQTYYPGGTTGLIMSKTAYAAWPLAGTVTVDVPDWATTLEIVCHISGYEVRNGTASEKQVAGVRTAFDGAASTQNGILVNYGGTPTRHHGSVIGRHGVTAAQRGTSRTIAVQGHQTAGAGLFESDYQTSVSLDWEFTEGPM